MNAIGKNILNNDKISHNSLWVVNKTSIFYETAYFPAG